MKRMLYLFAALFLLLCGCIQGDQSSELNVGSFSYTDDCTYNKDDPGVRLSEFVNTEKTELKNAEQAVELAKKECTVEYDTIDVAFDSELKIYKVSFYKEGWLGGDQNVYINQDGITQLIISGE